MVFAYHVGVNLRTPPFAAYGFCGVHMFFVLSGYLLFRPYASAMMDRRPLPETGNFYLRRFIRILPPYLLALILFVVLRSALRVKGPTPWNVISHALLIFNYSPRIDFYSINAVLWSLAIEVQFYLLLPVVCLIAWRACARRPGPVPVIVAVAGLLVLGVAARALEVHSLGNYYAAIGNPDGIRYRSTFAYLDLFAFGMAVAAVQMAGTPRLREIWQQPTIRVGLLLLGVALFFGANDWCARATGGLWQSTGPATFVICFPIVLCAALAALLFLIVTHAGDGPALLRFRWLRTVGEMSYSLYLYHVGVQFFILKLNLFNSWSYNHMTIGNALVAIGPALLVSAVMYRAVEKPCLRWVSTIRDRQVVAATTTDQSARAGDPAAPALQPVSLLGP